MKNVTLVAVVIVFLFWGAVGCYAGDILRSLENSGVIERGPDIGRIEDTARRAVTSGRDITESSQDIRRSAYLGGLDRVKNCRQVTVVETFGPPGKALSKQSVRFCVGPDLARVERLETDLEDVGKMTRQGGTLSYKAREGYYPKGLIDQAIQDAVDLAATSPDYLGVSKVEDFTVYARILPLVNKVEITVLDREGSLIKRDVRIFNSGANR